VPGGNDGLLGHVDPVMEDFHGRQQNSTVHRTSPVVRCGTRCRTTRVAPPGSSRFDGLDPKVVLPRLEVGEKRVLVGEPLPHPQPKTRKTSLASRSHQNPWWGQVLYCVPR
jgi:hypothetical protein